MHALLEARIDVYTDQMQVVITIWDVANIRKGQHSVFARQVSDFPITRLRWSPYDDLKLVSCGRYDVCCVFLH